MAITNDALIGANERFNKPLGTAQKHANLTEKVESIIAELKALKKHGQTPHVGILIDELEDALGECKE